MVDWMQNVEAQRAELRDLNELNYSRLDARMDRFDERLGELEVRIVSRLEAKIEQRFADLMKWSFVFWVGSVGAIAVLAGVLG